MKTKIILCVFIVICLTGDSDLVFAGNGSVLSISGGYMNTKDAKSGLIAGAGIGIALDESVDLGLAVDFYNKKYTKETQVATTDQEGLSSTLIVKEVEFSRTILPILLTINVKVPTSRYFGYFIRGGLGYELLFSKEKNYAEGTDENRNFGGLGWKFAGGMFYNVGSRSTLIANLFYNNCEVSRNVDQSVKGLPVQERVDLSGLGFRLGVAVEIR